MSYPFFSKRGRPVHSPAVWGGLECTLNRVGDAFVDQCSAERNGHDAPERTASDLSRFAEVGFERIRYPFLWEKAATETPGVFDWSDFDGRIERMVALGISPIAGLLHHGSGPAYTNLLDPSFPKLFAEYARAFAVRYPWITDYTPINEPLTTARFSGLYGVWYPHGRDDRAFVRALYNQVRATRDAMSAIREINPAARLIQTDDLGRARGTKRLQYQVEFENQRRWLAFDLLAGRVAAGHPLHYFLLKNGLSRAELSDLVDRPCAPDVIGVNHYLLSNRYLDHRLELYPDSYHGGNERHSYADVGAVDARHVPYLAPAEIYREAWQRYGIPVAVTEVHAHGPRETPLQWFAEVWDAACSLRAEGVDLCAVTAWSLLGTYDWNSLCTRAEGFYEPGVFDVSSGVLRDTALTRIIRSAIRTGELGEIVSDEPAWWRHPERGIFGETRAQDLIAPEGVLLKGPIE